MDSGRELIEALTMVSQEKGIDKEIIFEAIETSLVAACKKHFATNAAVRVVVSRETGAYTILAAKTVSETIADETAEITLEEARKINPQLELGDTIEIELKPGNFGRISAQTAKQVVVQKFREAEREILYNEYIDKQHEVITGVVQRRDRRNVMVSLGRMEAALPPSEQIPREPYNFGDRIKVYVLEVKQNTKGPLVSVSRTHPDLLRKLFEQEVPEVFDGIVEIKSIAREAGNRSKVAVYTKHPHVDAVGSCVGQSGQRVNVISLELRGEKLDIINWSEDPVRYIASALSPSKVVIVAVNPLEMMAKVIVPDHQLSLAIGKEGQNARLAARLTGWRIDIKSESQARGTDFLVFPELEDAVKEEENAKVEAAYAEFYEEHAEEMAEETKTNETETAKPEAAEAAPEAEAAPAAEAEAEYYGDEYYDDEYYEDEYYEDEYYDDEYYDDEYDDEYYDEAPQETAK